MKTKEQALKILIKTGWLEYEAGQVLEMPPIEPKNYVPAPGDRFAPCFITSGHPSNQVDGRYCKVIPGGNSQVIFNSWTGRWDKAGW